jgi:hypothetical protein
MKIKSIFAVVALAAAAISQATSVALYADGGENPAFDYLARRGYDVNYVTDADIARGEASKFDVLFYARNSGSFGSDLSSEATRAVHSGFKGNTVALFDDLTDLFIGDFAGTDVAGRLLENSIHYAAKNHGIVGEFRGAGWLVEQGYLSGRATGGAQYDGNEDHANARPDHEVMAGLDSYYNYSDGYDWNWGTSGLADENILGYDATGNVSVAYSTTQPVPEPMSMLALAGGAAGLLRRRRK